MLCFVALFYSFVSFNCIFCNLALLVRKKVRKVERLLIFIYGVFCYIIAMVGQAWFILYLSDWQIIENNIHTLQVNSLNIALLINVILIIVFASQHSIMARTWFKNAINKYISPAAERSTYALMSGLSLWLIVYFWQPIDGTLWHIESNLISSIIIMLFCFGWIFSALATFIINHFELFGLQQVYLNLVNKETPQINFAEKLFYRFIRHPIQLGILIGIWATPVMTYGHFTLSALFTIYIFIGLYFEEKDLVNALGDVYIDYKQRIGMVFPKIKK